MDDDEVRLLARERFVARPRRRFQYEFQESLRHEARTREENGQIRAQIDVSQQRVQGCLEELLEGFIVIALLPHTSFLRDRRFHLLSQHRSLARQDGQMRQPFLHDHGPDVRLLDGIASLLDEIPRHGIPPVLFLQGEVPVQFQVQGVPLAHLGVFGLFDDPSRDVELRGLGVEIELFDSDEEVDVHSCGGCGARG